MNKLLALGLLIFSTSSLLAGPERMLGVEIEQERDGGAPEDPYGPDKNSNREDFHDPRQTGDRDRRRDDDVENGRLEIYDQIQNSFRD